MMTDKDPEYEIEAILDHQGTSANTRRYMVKCLRYPELDWQLLANLKGGCRDLLRDYHRKLGLLFY